MADYKVVVVFQQTTTGEANAPTLGYATVPRTAGWTESYWDTGTTLEGVITRLKGPRTNGLQPILPSRASVLNSQARILGARIYEGGGGRGQFVPMSYPGGSRGGDQPSVALLIAATSLDTISVRRWTLRGIPDDQVINGEFSPSSGYREDLRTYFDSLAGTNFRGRSTVPSQGIFNVTTGGLVTATSALAYAVGAIVTVQTTLDEQGNRRSGQYQVGAVGPLNNQITLVGWPWGTTTGGKISQPASAYFQILTGGIKAVRITTRKVGRPFAAYRGKNSRASRKH